MGYFGSFFLFAGASGDLFSIFLGDFLVVLTLPVQGNLTPTPTTTAATPLFDSVAVPLRVTATITAIATPPPFLFAFISSPIPAPVHEKPPCGTSSFASGPGSRQGWAHQLGPVQGIIRLSWLN